MRQTVKSRPTLDSMRRANSMSNLLEEDNIDIDEVDERNAHGNNSSSSASAAINTSSISESKVNLNNSTSAAYRGNAHHNHHHYSHNLEYNGKSSTNQNGSYGKFEKVGPPDELATDDASSTTTTTSSSSSTKMSNGNSQRCRPRALQRGNDSLKRRCRSVEALMRYDTLAWRRDVEDSEDYPSSNPIILDEIIVSDYQSTVIKAKTADSITIEDKIQQAREKNRMSDPKPPRRLASLMSESERPPPDLVKQTLLKFEATANRRARATSIQRYSGHGDVAAKVAEFKSKLSQDKIVLPVSPPIQITSKLPPSGFQTAAATTSMAAKKPVIKPRTTSPKAGASPPFFNGSKMEQIAKKSVSTHSKSHEQHDTTDHHHTHHYQMQQQQSSAFNGNGLKSIDVERMNQKNAANTIRIDTYRNNKYNEAISPDSPTVISPTNSDSPRYVIDMVRRRETNQLDSPLITQLARKTENIHLSTPKIPKSHKMLAEVASYNDSADDSSVQPASSDNDDECDDGTSSETGWSESYDVNISDNENGCEEFLAKKPPVPRSKQFNGSGSGGGGETASTNNKMKTTVINVTPIQTNGAFDKPAKSVDHQPEPSVRQIGIIRPLNHAEAPAKHHPIPIARKSQHKQSLPTLSSTSSASMKKVDSTDAIKVNVASAPIVVSTQHSLILPTSTSSVVVTNSVSVATTNDCQGGTDVVVIECGDSNISTTKSMSSPPIPTTPPPTANNRTKLITNTESNTISIDTRSIVHQKNLLNKEKSEEVLNGSNGDSCSGTSPPTLMIQSPIKWNIKKSTVVSSSPVAPTALSPTTLVVNQNTASSSPQMQPSTASGGSGGGNKQRPNDIHTTNTMVFNFSNRKDVPDYIENDGLVIRRKRELPKVSAKPSFFCNFLNFGYDKLRIVWISK